MDGGIVGGADHTPTTVAHERDGPRMSCVAAEVEILSILRAPPCREFDADGKGVGCVIDYMTISEDTHI